MSPGAETRRVEPQRTCVGCRAVAPQRSLLRGVCDAAGRVLLDAAFGKRSGGRGFYVHGRDGCLRKAVHGGVQRSLRRTLRIDERAFFERLTGLPSTGTDRRGDVPSAPFLDQRGGDHGMQQAEAGERAEASLKLQRDNS